MAHRLRRGNAPERGVLPLGLIAASFAAVPTAGIAEPPSDRLDEVIVTSSLIAVPRRTVGAAVSVLGGEEIELRGYASVADALRTQPGIGVTNNGGVGKTTALRIRGEEHFRTLLMIDGVKAVDPSAPQVAPAFDSLLATSDLERIEILRGPQGFIYGADAGGVVNVLTRPGAGEAGGRIGVEFGEYDTAKYDAHVAGGGEGGDYFVSVTDLETDGFNSQTSDTVLADADGAENTTLHAKLGWNATDALRVQLVARDIDAAALYDGCFSLATFATTHDCRSLSEQTTYKLSAEHDGERFGHAFGYSDADIARRDFADGADAFATRGTLRRFEYTGSYRPTEATTLVYGLDLERDEVTGSTVLERKQEGYYAEYQGRFGERVFLSVGARYDDNEDFGTHTSTRLSGAFVQDLGRSRSLKYRASFGTGFRAPSLFEIAYNEGPFAFPPASLTTLTEESSRGYDVGAEYEGARGLHVEVTYFDHEIEDEIFFDLVGFSGYLQSPGASMSAGVEVATAVPVSEQWQFLANWTRNDAESAAGEPRLRRPETLANLGFTFSSADDRLRFLVNYRLSSDSLDVGNVALEDYAVLDLSATYSLGATFEVFARVENATDEDYEELVGYRAAGRAAYAGARFRF
jgi:vitamin B12 transporter